VEGGSDEGARHGELGQLTSQAHTMARDCPVIFQCRSGVPSLLAALALGRAGYEACPMRGGLFDWSAEGQPVVAEEAAPR
jgi:hydroxyacylglutathione hydrolase